MRPAAIKTAFVGALAVAAVVFASSGTAHAQEDKPTPPTDPAAAEAVERIVPQGRDQITLSFAPLVDKAAPAVVNIFTRKLVREGAVSPLLEEPIIKRLFGRALPQFGEREKFENSLGSGVIVAPDGVGR